MAQDMDIPAEAVEQEAAPSQRQASKYHLIQYIQRLLELAGKAEHTSIMMGIRAVNHPLWEMPLLAEIPGYLRSGGAVVNPVASGEADLKAVEAAEMAAVILITAQTAAMLLQQRLPLLPKQNPLVAAALEEKEKIIAVPVRQMALSAVQPTLAEAAAVAMVLEKIKRVITMTVLALMVIPDSSASGCT